MLSPLETRQATKEYITAKNEWLCEEERYSRVEIQAKKVWILTPQPSFLVAFSERKC